MNDAQSVQLVHYNAARSGGRQAWAERIRAAYGQTVEAVFQVGRELLQAKNELPHGEFTAMIERELPFSARTAQMFMAIASVQHFQKRNIVSLLPCSWGTLYTLQRLAEPAFDAAVAAGKVHPEMTRAEAEALLPGRTKCVQAIIRSYELSIERVFQVGENLLQAKEMLPHGEFEALIDQEFPGRDRLAQKFIAIASSVHLQNARSRSVLSNDSEVLYVLTRLDASTFQAAVAAGKVNPDMTPEDAEALLPARKVAQWCNETNGEGGVEA